MKKDLTYEEQLTLIRCIGEVYQRSRKRMDIYEYENTVMENKKTYDSDAQLMYFVDRALKDCSANTKCIIRHEFLEKNKSEWYRNFFSKSAYYRNRKVAVEEFLRCLNI